MSEALRPIVKKLDIVQIQRNLKQVTLNPIAEDICLTLCVFGYICNMLLVYIDVREADHE